MSDNVNKPAHYNAGEVETIDGIRAALGEGFADYCRGNVLKYVWRCGLKGNAVEDLRKAAKYLEWAIEATGGNCPVISDSSSSKPLAIPSGWRELEPDEVPKANDMHEWMGVWYYRNDDATNEYKWHSNRHIRKIEPEEPKPLEIPEGWRELKHDEFPKVTDLYENEGAWRSRIDDSSFLYARYDVRHIRKIEPDERKPVEIPAGWRELVEGEMRSKTDLYLHGETWKFYVDYDPAGHEFPKYDKAIHRKHIRKIETANPSVNPNSSTWIPKVGDKVRLLKGFSENIGETGIVQKVDGRNKDVFLIDFGGFVEGWYSTHYVQLIEAAS